MTRADLGAMTIVLVAGLCLGLSVGSATAGMLTVSDDGTDYTLTAPGYWEMKILMASGNIFSFKDLTDAGYGGGNYSYMAQDGYNKARGVLAFSGRSGSFMHGTAIPSSGSITVSIAPDNSYFKMAYSETYQGGSGSGATYMYGGDYSTDATNGCTLTRVEVVINEPTVNGTIIEWGMTNRGTRLVTDTMDPKYFFAGGGIRSHLADGRTMAGGYASVGTSEGMNITRTITNGGDWAEATVGNTALNTLTNGLTAGRTFRLERLTGGAGGIFPDGGGGHLSYNAGNTWVTHVPATPPPLNAAIGAWWAAIDGMTLGEPASYGTAPGNYERIMTGTLTIDIATPPPADEGFTVITR